MKDSKWRRIRIVWLFLWVLAQCMTPVIFGEEPENTGDTAKFVSQFYNQNEKCFRCHGSTKYTYYNSVLGKNVTAMMCEERVIHREDFYTSNHKGFACTDCHDEAYDSFPHPGNLRMQMQYNCLDCHGGDPKYAKYHFEEIDSEFVKSIHYKNNPEAFTCWQCHNPHTYKINIRNAKNIAEAIVYDNQICLNCHSNVQRFQLLTNKKEINLIQKHDWLPNQALHFTEVRCIECHARQNDSLLVPHQIMPKEKAVKRCVECHTQNSLLMSSLYKYQSKANRTEAGFLNAILLNHAFVIGANRNIFLNHFSVILFGIVLLGLLIHLFLRIIIKKHRSDND